MHRYSVCKAQKIFLLNTLYLWILIFCVMEMAILLFV